MVLNTTAGPRANPAKPGPVERDGTPLHRVNTSRVVEEGAELERQGGGLYAVPLAGERRTIMRVVGSRLVAVDHSTGEVVSSKRGRGV